MTDIDEKLEILSKWWYEIAHRKFLNEIADILNDEHNEIRSFKFKKKHDKFTVISFCNGREYEIADILNDSKESVLNDLLKVLHGTSRRFFMIKHFPTLDEMRVDLMLAGLLH